MKEIEKIQEIQDRLYLALCYFDDLCREYNLRYFLANGSLLGAAKYGAFVPWDDDADVLMPREDYDKLVHLSINSSDYRLLAREQVDTWRMPYAKLSCERTRIEEREYDFGAPLGLSLDIFPLDAWSDLRPIAYAESLLADCRKRMLVYSIGGDFATEKTGLRRHVLKTLYRMGKRCGHARLSSSITKHALRGGRRRRYVGPRVWTSHRSAEVLPAEIFVKTVPLSLRGRDFPAPVGYVRYLERLYGDWRADLPVEKQCSNHEMKAWWRDEN